ncbi:MAG: hypothetical protein Q9179_002543 [Wetmoreana sp. 5 TL-2023]
MAKLQESMTLDEFINSYGETTISQSDPDLPTELAFMDISSTLPKLSILPIGGSQGDIFSSRLSLETVFKTMPTGFADYADLLVVGHEDGSIHLSMSEDFAIGRFELQDIEPGLSGSKPFLHCSHPLSTTHALLVSTNLESLGQLHLVPFDLRLIFSAGRYLSLLASKVTELHNLIRYLRQVQEQISLEIQTAQDLPSRFMRNVNETLQEESGCTWVQAAYHHVVTGHCYPEVKEWLVDELGERGHKRWDKAVNTGYETVRRLTHENLLPALERLSVLISRLRGFSRFQTSDFLLGLSSLELSNMLDTVYCLQLLSNYLLKCADSELQEFGAFSIWLRHEIEKQAADPTSASAQEIAEKDMSFDHASILGYIQGAMRHSRMTIYSDNPADCSSQWNLNVDGGLLFELYKKELQESVDSLGSRKQLPGLNGLLGHLQIKIFRIRLAVEKGVSSTKSVKCAQILVSTGTIRSLKFVDDECLMLAFVGQNAASRLLRFSYTQSDDGLLYHDTSLTDRAGQEDFDSRGAAETCGINLKDPTDIANHTVHRFPVGKTWTPQSLEVNGRKGRRMICVLAEDNLHYRQYDLDSLDLPGGGSVGADETDQLDVAMSTD